MSLSSCLQFKFSITWFILAFSLLEDNHILKSFDFYCHVAIHELILGGGQEGDKYALNLFAAHQVLMKSVAHTGDGMMPPRITWLMLFEGLTVLFA